MTLLKMENVGKAFGGLKAVSDFNLDLKKGEIVGLIGPNGAGKTTAFNLITSIHRATTGSIHFYAEEKEKIFEITKMKRHAITKLGIARTFQNIQLFSGMSVLENVKVACHMRSHTTLLEATLRLPRYRKEEKHVHEKVMALLKAVNLDDNINEPATSLPYGKQRRLEIARALATDPQLLLLDEPAAGMNPQESGELMDFIRRIRDEFKVTVFMIEHHMKVVMGVCERIKVIDHGVTIADGKPHDIQNNQKVIEAYLGVDISA